MIYIAGPMTGRPDCNYEAFHMAARTLRGMGWDVINPAENFDGRQDLTWRTYLKKAVHQVADADIVVVLPGYEDSRGVALELNVARELGIDVIEYDKMIEIETAYRNTRGFSCP
jgi:hypothetical protein